MGFGWSSEAERAAINETDGEPTLRSIGSVLAGDKIDWLLRATFSVTKTLVGSAPRESFDAIGNFDEPGFSLRLNYHPYVNVSEDVVEADYAGTDQSG